MNITPFHFRELLVKGYSLDQLFVLRLVNEQMDFSTLMTESAKVTALKQSLIRKGLIYENEDKLTTLGHELLIFMETKEEVKFVKKKVDVSEFEEWWKAYPGSDTFEHKGKIFRGCRSLRLNRDECRIKFNKILLEGEYSANELIEGLKYDVQQKLDTSVKTNINKLTFMQNSLTYLNQRSYEPIMEQIKKGFPKEETKVYGGTDI